MEGIGVGLIVVIVIIAFLELALVIWALIDVIQRPHPSGLPKWLWVVIILFFNFFGPILYLLLGRREDTIVDDWRTQAANQQYVAPPQAPAPPPPPRTPVPPTSAQTPAPSQGAAASAPPLPAEPARDEAAGDDAAIPAAPAAPEVPDVPEPGRARTERAIDTLYGPEKPAD